MPRLALAALAAVIALSPAAAARTTFFAGLEDVPVPPGFIERAEAATAFEGPPGRILLAAAEGPGPAEAAQSWAVTALKGLGWSLSEAESRRAVLIRGRETLTLDSAPAPAGRATLQVRVIVRPAPSEDE